MKITWYGHAAFLLEGEGTRVILDPYQPGACGTYAPINEPADVVLLSHWNEKYHSHLPSVLGSPKVVQGLELFDGRRTVCGIEFGAVRVWENEAREEPIAMPVFSLEGVRVCHMGDLGHPLSVEEAAPIRGVDVLLALAGGPPTIRLPDLVDAIRLIAPRVVIPMHFLTPKINLNLRPVEDFLALMPPDHIRRVKGSSVDVTRDTLRAQTEVVVLESAR